MFSERFLQLRKERDLTQKQLANELHFSENAIQNYERKRRSPTYDALIHIADFFNVSIDYLVGRTDNPSISR
jgi:transcriptional regulator with XRE-family HTH domain